VRGIPIYWRILDSLFGVFGAIPLAYCLKRVREIARLEKMRAPEGPIT
jgi:hypothetical protein